MPPSPLPSSTSAALASSRPAVEDAFWTRSQTAAYLNVSSKWLAQSGRAAGPRYYKFGSRVRYHSGDVRAWAAQQKVAR